ncbi:MAG: bacteriohopanetetrol glucosamine biosynthesis glycosyltransferase HpnI [Bryobacteraceae bacterium]
MIWIAFLPATVYQCLAIYAGLRHLVKRHSNQLFARWRPSSGSPQATSPGVSVLKPLRGLDANTYEAFVSQIRQRYPTFEILFGVREDDDSAAAEVRRLIRDFPDAPVRLIVGAASVPNGKVGVLMELARHARYPVWVVNDSDIKVGPTYLSGVTGSLVEPKVGLVTCLYRARAHSLPATWEALGITTDFMPSALVASVIGVREFGFGSTLAFRAADLERVGGFAALADYLADDYQLAKRITSIGKSVLLSTYVVETSVNEFTWRGVWQHQLRWARTIRVSKGLGYAGLPITHAGVWALIALACGAWVTTTILVFARIASALITGGFVLRSSVGTAFCWLAPVWDVYAFAVWVESYVSREVRWRDRILAIDSEGRIQV